MSEAGKHSLDIYSMPMRVLVAGIGGASLGTEILKCLRDASRYTVFGCDISAFAYGHYQEGFAETFVVDRDRYVESVLEFCLSHGVQAVIPGGEGPLGLLSRAAARFGALGISIASNSPEVIATCSDKQQLFARLHELGLPAPRTMAFEDVSAFHDCADVPYPCVIKPSAGTGGSRLVFLASNPTEAALYLTHLLHNARTALIQEYIPLHEGEFTVGVLSLPDSRLVGSIAMQRLFHTKLSVLTEERTGLISSGYSQGLIEELPEVRAQAETIAMALGSVGPVNIQGRLRNGILLPFEINPRFSASTYLRAMAGFNEIDIFLHYLLRGVVPPMDAIRPGYYLRSLAEIRVSQEEIKE